MTKSKHYVLSGLPVGGVGGTFDGADAADTPGVAVGGVVPGVPDTALGVPVGAPGVPECT